MTNNHHCRVRSFRLKAGGSVAVLRPRQQNTPIAKLQSTMREVTSRFGNASAWCLQLFWDRGNTSIAYYLAGDIPARMLPEMARSVMQREIDDQNRPGNVEPDSA